MLHRRLLLQQNETETIECPLIGFLPFTTEGKAWDTFGLDGATSWPYTHLAAALMAVDDFNARDNRVVVDLEKVTANCTVSLPDPVFSNTDNTVVETATFLVHELQDNQQQQPFCGIVGPWFDAPALEAAHFAGGMDIPMVTHGATDTTLANYKHNPLVASVTVDLNVQAEAVAHWLRKEGRTDFLATLAGTRHEFGKQFQVAIDTHAKEAGFERLSYYIFGPGWGSDLPNRGVSAALQGVKKDGYRNIFLVLDRDVPLQLQYVADYAHEFGMTNGDYVWVLSGNIDPATVAYHASTNANISKLVRGMSLIRPIDGFSYLPLFGDESDGFLESWQAQNASFVDRVNALHPINNDTENPGYFQGSATYFQDHLPEHGAGFMYDAVMAQAIGRCQQQEQQRDSKGGMLDRPPAGERERRSRRVKGDSSPRRRGQAVKKSKKQQENLNPHLKGIADSEFHGATGMIAFGESYHTPAARKRETVTFGAYNFRQSEAAELAKDSTYTTWYYLTDVLRGGSVDGQWTSTSSSPFIFANGLSSPPVLNRDVPEQNYLSSAVQIAGLVLFALALSIALVSTVFICLKRKHKAIRESQPPFLLILLAGCIMMTMAILTLSFDEGSGWTEEMLDKACTASPWLISLGYNSIYLALFSKLWRINKVLQFKRRKVTVHHVVGPFLLLILCNIIVLVVWTVTDPFIWVREETDFDSGESYGRCNSDHSLAFVATLAVLMCFSTGACAAMAWKCKDIDSRFSESKWIFYTIFVQIQVLLLGFPILIILDKASADATYLGRVLLLFVVVITTILLMIGPKLFRVYFVKKSNTATNTAHGSQMRGSVGGDVNVSGLKSSAYSIPPPTSVDVPKNLPLHSEGAPAKRLGLKSSISDERSEESNY